MENKRGGEVVNKYAKIVILSLWGRQHERDRLHVPKQIMCEGSLLTKIIIGFSTLALVYN